MPRLADLRRKNANGLGTKPALNLRVPLAFKQAAQQIALEESLAQGKKVTTSEVVVNAALKDQRLRHLANQLARTSQV